ncbi:MAG: ATP-binding protein [Alphaproteobacteria bacterium]|nr:ATP-binding protein [Alphaproteobacteria bacterium]
MYKRPLYKKVIQRLEGTNPFIQVLAGPRQIGKTTLAHQARQALSLPSHYASADGSLLRDTAWIEAEWEKGRILAQRSEGPFGALLILDEIQKIPNWSDTVKKLWDEDVATGLNLKVMILGSSSLLIQTGLGESLAGRCELIPIAHWSFSECQEAFGLTLEQYIYFGGYPAAAILIQDEERWARYIVDSLIETSISRDVMLMTRVYKPALLRRIFEIGCHYTGHVLSYQKMLGQLQDAGNVATLAHYLELLSGVGLVTGLQKFSPDFLRQKASSPKLQVLNTALTSAQHHLSFGNTKKNQTRWEKLVESTIGAHLMNSIVGTNMEVFYWKEGTNVVDFIIRKDENLTVIEVNNTQKGKNARGLEVFIQKFQPTKTIFVGEGGISVEEFLRSSPDSWM